jgi:hypothetical protein
MKEIFNASNEFVELSQGQLTSKKVSLNSHFGVEHERMKRWKKKEFPLPLSKFIYIFGNESCYLLFTCAECVSHFFARLEKLYLIKTSLMGIILFIFLPFFHLSSFSVRMAPKHARRKLYIMNNFSHGRLFHRLLWLSS